MTNEKSNHSLDTEKLSLVNMGRWWREILTQEMKMEDLPLLSRPSSKAKKISSWLSILSTVILLLSAGFFRLRWNTGISSAPINLPTKRYVFIDHPELRSFDQKAIDLWQVYAKHHWWSMEWRDPAGNRLTQGIDMLHKLHCLVAIREEFTLMATDEGRRDYFNAHNAESLTRRLHIKHCFDFIRQVNMILLCIN
jgi:hypothetical protein